MRKGAHSNKPLWFLSSPGKKTLLFCVINVTSDPLTLYICAMYLKMIVLTVVACEIGRNRYFAGTDQRTGSGCLLSGGDYEYFVVTSSNP